MAYSWVLTTPPLGRDSREFIVEGCRSAVRADVGGEGVAVSGLRLLAHGTGAAAGHPGDHVVRRAARAACAARAGRPPGHRGEPAGDMLPDRVRAGFLLGPGTRAPGRAGTRGGGHGAGR